MHSSILNTSVSVLALLQAVLGQTTTATDSSSTTTSDSVTSTTSTSVSVPFNMSSSTTTSATSTSISVGGFSNLTSTTAASNLTGKSYTFSSDRICKLSRSSTDFSICLQSLLQLHSEVLQLLPHLVSSTIFFSEFSLSIISFLEYLSL